MTLVRACHLSRAELRMLGNNLPAVVRRDERYPRAPHRSRPATDLAADSPHRSDAVFPNRGQGGAA